MNATLRQLRDEREARARGVEDRTVGRLLQMLQHDNLEGAADYWAACTNGGQTPLWAAQVALTLESKGVAPDVIYAMFPGALEALHEERAARSSSSKPTTAAAAAQTTLVAAKTSRRAPRDEWSPMAVLDDDLYGLVFSFLGLKYAPSVGATCKAWFVLQWQRLRQLRSLENVRTLPTTLRSPMFADGDLYVCDTRDHSIKHVCAETGAVRQTLRQPAWRKPRSLCVTPTCLYVVAWSDHHSEQEGSAGAQAGVHRLRRSDGALLASAYSCGGLPLRNPHGCALVEGAVLFVADTGHDRVCVFDLALRPLFELGGFAQPNSVASLPSSRELYVCDTYSHRLKVFRLHERRPASAADVSFVRTIGGGPGPPEAVRPGFETRVPAGHFYMPRSVAVAADRIVVVEASRVHVLTRQGEPLLVHEAAEYGLLRGVVAAPAAHRLIVVDEVRAPRPLGPCHSAHALRRASTLARALRLCAWQGASKLHLLSTRCTPAPTAHVLSDLAGVVHGARARFEVARHVERRRSEAPSTHNDINTSDSEGEW